MTMDSQSYLITHPSDAIKNFRTIDDVVTELANLFSIADEQYHEQKFSRTSKNFPSDDVHTKSKHQTALPLLIGLNAGVTEIIAHWPEPNSQKKMRDIYDQKRRGKNLPLTPLNELNTRLSNLKRLVDYMKSEFPIAIRRTFYYQDHKLYIDQLKPIPFRQNSDADIVLQLLFKNKFKKWKYLALENKLIQIRLSPKSEYSYGSLAKPLKKACEHINLQIGKKYNEYEQQKIILNLSGYVEVNTELFHVTDRLNRKT